jgi:hypothetical protein
MARVQVKKEIKMKTPEKLQKFMDMVMREARRDSLTDLRESYDISDMQYQKIKEWFESFGIAL